MRSDRIMRFREYQPYRRRYDYPRSEYRDDYYNRRIGFSADSRAEYERGYAISQSLVDDWMHGLENEDGSKGAHWNIEQTTNIL